MTSLRAGVIGTGYLGKFHAEKYASLPGVELVGIADPDVERSSELAAKLQTKSYADAAELLGLVDAVSVVAPTVLHHRIAKQFLAAGVHVLLEKPMTVTLEEAAELIDLAASGKLILQIGHIERFNPALTAIKPYLASPRFVQVERSAPFTVRCTDVNVVLDLMIHDLDIVADIAGARPREVSAAGASVITRDIDAATARIVFENGCVADVAASRVSDEKKRQIKVFDGDSLYTADFQSQKAFVSRRRGETAVDFIATELPTERRDTLLDEITAFVRSVTSGNRPLVTGQEGRNALALARLITENIEKGNKAFVPVEP
jgi:predicted dehydrogenase